MQGGMEASDASVSEGGGSVFSENPFEELFLQETNGELPPLESKEWEEQADKVLTAALKLVKELKECQPAAALQAASKSAAKAALQVKAEERTGEGGRGVRGRGGKGGRRQTDREKGADAAEQPSRDLVSASLKKATDLLSRLRSLLSLASSPQRAKAIFTDEVLLGATAAMKAHMKETVFICAADPDVVGGKVTMRQCVTTNEIETFFVTLRSVLSAAEELLVLVHVPEQHLHTIAAAAASLFQVPHLSAARQCQKKALDLLCTMQSRFGADVGQSVAMEVSNLLPDIAVRPMSTLKRWEWYDISTGRTLHLFTYVALRVAQAASAPVDRVGISRGTPFDKMVSAGGDSLTVERTISGQVLHQCAIRAESPEMKEKGRFLFTDFWKAAQCPLFPSAMNFVVLLCRGLCLLISRQANALVGVDRQQQAAAAAAEEEGGDDEKEDGEAGEEKKEKGKGAGGGKKKPPPAPTGPGRQALSALDHFTNLLGVSARHVFTDHKESQTLRVDERRSREKGCPCGRNFSATGDGPEDPTEEDENAGRVVRCSRCEAWMHSACAEDAADSLAVSVTVDPINNLPTSVGQWMCDFCALREFAFARADETQRAAPGTLEFVAQGAAEAQEMIRNEQRAAAAEEQQQQQQRDERGAVKVKKEPGLEEEEDEEAYQAMEVEIAMELDKDDNASPCTGAAAAAAAFQNLSTSFEDRLAVCHGLLHATDTGKACDVPKEAGTGGMMRGEMMMENGENAVDIRLNNKVLLSHDHPLFARSRLLTYWACENVEKKRIESSRNKKRGGAAAAAGRAEQKDEKKAKKKRKEEKKRSGSRRRVSSSDEEDEEGEEEEEEMYANGRRGGRRGASSRRSSRAAAAVQKENRGGGRRGKKRDDENQEERPSRNVKRIKMENPDDEPQEMDLDETEKEDEGRGGGSEVAGLGSEEEESRYRSFLAKEWETPILLDGQNRRTSLDLPSGFITRVWQQYRAAALADFRDRALEIVCMETGPAKQGTVRRAGMVLLQEMLSAEPGLVEDSRAQEVIFRGLSDEGAKVRQATMGLLNCLLFDQAAGVRGILKEEEMAGREGGGEDEAGISLSVSLDGNGGGESSPVGAGAGRGTGNGASFGRQFLRRCVGRLESALNDPSPLVRKSAVGILQAVVLEEPQSDVALQVCLQFVDRVVDREETDHVKGLTLDLFRKLWVSGAVEFNRTICTHMIQSVRYFEKRRTQFRIDSDSLLAQVVERAKTVWEKEATGGRGGRKSNPVDAALERWATELRGALADTHGGDLEGGGGEGGHEGGAAAAAAASSAPGAASTRLQRTNTASSSYAFFQNSKRLTQTAVLAVLEIVAEMKPSLVTGCWGNLTPLLAPPEWKNMSPQERAEKAEVLAIVGRIVTRLCPHLTNAESRPSEEIVELQEILLIHMQTGPLNRSIIEAVKCFCALAQHIRRDVFHVVNLLVNGIQQIHSVYQEVFRARQWLLFHNQRGYRPAGAEMSLEEAREALLKKAPHRLRRFILVVGAVWDSVDVNAVCLEIATKEEEEAEGVKQEEEDGSYRSPPSSTNRNCPQTPTRGKRGTPRRSPSSKGRGSAALSTALSKTPVSEARLRRVSSSALEKMMQERGMGSEAVRPYGRDPARACFEDFCKLWDLGGKEGGGMSAASGGMPLRDQIKGMVLDGLLLFLNGQRKFIREKKLHDILENALRHPVLQLKGLHLMHELLKQAQEDAVKRAKEEAARLPSTVIKVKAEEGGGLEDEDDDGMGDQSDDAEAGLTGPTRKGRRSTGCALKSPHTNGDAATHDDTTHIHDEERMAGERDSAQPLALLLPSVLNCIRGTQQGGSTPSGTTGTPNRHERERQHQHEGGGGGNSNSNSSLLVCSLALDVVERLRAAGFINPSQAIAPVFCLSFSDNALLRSQTARVLRLITETRRETLLSSLGDCLLDAFFFLLRRFPGQLRLFEPLRPSSLQPFVDLYARTFQQKRRDRERSIRVLLHQLETLSESERLGKFMEKVKEVRKKQKEEQRSDFEEFSNEKFLLLFLQFAASTVAALPCVFESEALFAVHRLNHLISIKSHLQTANPGGEEEGDSEMGDPEGGEGGAGVSAVSPSGLGGLGGDPQQRVPEMEVFGLCACVCTALILKDCFKTAYGLSDERCAQYDPGEALLREQKKYAGVGRGVLLAGGDEEGEKGEEFGGAVESSFDIDAFEERCTALLDASGDVALLRGELAEAVASADGTKDLNEALLAKQVKTAEERQWRELLGKGKRKSAAAGGEEEDEEGKGTKRGRGGPSAKALAKRSAARPKKAAGGVSGQKTKAKGGKKKKRRRGEDEDSDEEDDDESDFVP